MPNANKRRGDRAELEVQAILQDNLGVGRRALGAGRKDDLGDIHGVPNTVIQVANYQDLARAVREKLPELEAQQARAGAPYAALWVRRPGGRWVVCQTPTMWMNMLRETL